MLARLARFSKSSCLAAVLLGSTVSPTRAADQVAPSQPETTLTQREEAFGARLQAIHAEAVRRGSLAGRLGFAIVPGVDADGHQVLVERTPFPTLVDEARGSTDPVVLQLLLYDCIMPMSHGRCDAVAVARRWIEADTQNQVAWLGLVEALHAQGDTVGEHAAFLRAAEASMWQGGYRRVSRALLDDLPRDLTPPERLALASSRSAPASSVQIQTLQTLNRSCKSTDADQRRACTRIVDTIARDADTMMDVATPMMFGHYGDFNRERLVAFRRRHEALVWGFLNSLTDDSTTPSDIEDTPRVHDELARFDAMMMIGERAYAERQLADRHVTETEAVKRYVATMSKEQLQYREQRIEGH